MASSIFIGFFPGVPWSVSGSTVTITGTLSTTGYLAGDGTAAAPSYSFASDTDVGWFYSNTAIAWSIAGTKRGVLGSGIRLADNVDLAWSTDPGVVAPDVSLSRGAANRLTLAVGDVLNLAPTAFGSLPAAAEGNLACVTDSSTATWGATITGGGANNVLAFHNGTNWTVFGA